MIDVLIFGNPNNEHNTNIHSNVNNNIDIKSCKKYSLNF